MYINSTHTIRHICNGCFKGVLQLYFLYCTWGHGGGYSPTWVRRVDQGMVLRFLSLKQGIQFSLFSVLNKLFPFGQKAFKRGLLSYNRVAKWMIFVFWDKKSVGVWRSRRHTYTKTWVPSGTWAFAQVVVAWRQRCSGVHSLPCTSFKKCCTL